MRAEALELRDDLPGGRRELRLQLGPIAVAVTEVPSPSLTEDDWGGIQLARRSYPGIYGGGHVGGDRLDGRGADASVYDTRHYLAWVRDGADPAKLVTARKVLLRPSGLTPEQRASPGELLPIALRFWKVRTAGGDVPLWEPLRVFARSLDPCDPHPEFRIASGGWFATFPFGERGQTPRQRERAVIAWAAIHLLATHADRSLLYVRTIRPEFPNGLMVLRDVHGNRISPPFTPTEQLLGLPPGSVGLDNGLEVVQDYKAAVPGYFINNRDAAGVLAALLDEGRLTVADLRPTIGRLIEHESGLDGTGRELEELVGLGTDRDHRRIAEVLTRVRLFKYLIPLLAGDEPLTRMELAELRTRLLYETGDGPFSSTVLPEVEAARARAILDAAARKHALVPLGRDPGVWSRPV